MVHRVDHGKEFPRAPVVPQASEGHCRPDGRMRVLPAVFSHAGDIPFDVAGIQLRLVEGRIQKLDQSMLAANEALIHSFHGHARTLGVSRTGKNGPALRNRIDPAFGVNRRSKRRAVVEVSAAIPLAVPAMLFDIAAQLAPPLFRNARQKTRRHACGQPR